MHTPRPPVASRLIPARSPPAPCALLATLGSTRRPSTRTSLAGTPPASRTCATCLTCAAPRAPRPAPPNLQSHPLPCTPPVCTAIAPVHPRRRLARRPSYPARPPCDSAARTLPVRRQQAAHPLRVGGQPVLRPLVWLGLGAGKLPLKPSPRCACGRGRVYGGCLYHSPQLVRGDHSYTDVREGMHSAAYY